MTGSTELRALSRTRRRTSPGHASYVHMPGRSEAPSECTSADPAAESPVLCEDSGVSMDEKQPIQTRHALALQASRDLPKAKADARQAWELRAADEAKLERCQDQLGHLTGIGPGTWWLRLTSRLSDRQSKAQEGLRQQEATTLRTIASQEAAVRRLAEVQAGADDLPAAREAAVAAMSGAEADEARRALDDSQELAEAIFAASISLVAFNSAACYRACFSAPPVHRCLA